MSFLPLVNLHVTLFNVLVNTASCSLVIGGNLCSSSGNADWVGGMLAGHCDFSCPVLQQSKQYNVGP